MAASTTPPQNQGPGLALMRIDGVDMKFNYKDAFETAPSTAAKRLSTIA
jgi:hypothetical protein